MTTKQKISLIFKLIILPVVGCTIGSSIALINNFRSESRAEVAIESQKDDKPLIIEAIWIREDKHATLFLKKEPDKTEFEYVISVIGDHEHSYQGIAQIDESYKLEEGELSVYCCKDNGMIRFIMREDESIVIKTDEIFQQQIEDMSLPDGIYRALNTKKVTQYYPYFTHVFTEEVEIEKLDYIEIVPGQPIYYEIWRESLMPIQLPVESTITLDPEVVRQTLKQVTVDERLSYKEIMKNCYFRFQGSYIGSKSSITDDKQFEEYHLNKRSTPDSLLCANQEDEQNIIAKRKEVFESSSDSLEGDVEFVLYQNKDTGGEFIGIYLSGGQYLSDEISLSTGTYETGFYFNEIDLSSGGVEDSYTYDAKENFIRVTGQCKPYYTDTGGLASNIEYDINLYFSDTGIVLAGGTITVDGYGSEKLEYELIATAVEAQAEGFKIAEYEFKETLFAYESIIELPPKQINVTDYITLQMPYWEKIGEGSIPTYETRYRTVENYVSRRKKLKSKLHWGAVDVEVPTELETEQPKETELETEKPRETKLETEKPMESPTESPTEKPTEKPIEIPTKTPQSGENEPNLVKYDSSKIKAEASSELSKGNVTYSAHTMLDGSYITAWMEGVSGYGEGETITFYFDETVDLGEIRIANGYLNKWTTYENNARVKEMVVEFSNGEFIKVYLDDMYFQGVGSTEYTDIIKFDDKITTNYVTMTIVSVNEGEEHENTCITEMEFFVYEEDE